MADKYVKRLLSRREACAYIGYGLTSGMQHLEQTNAEVRVGKRRMYDIKKLDEFIDKQTEKTG